MHAARLIRRQQVERFQEENTLQLEHGYTAMPAIAPGAVGWELHPPVGAMGGKGKKPVSHGKIWYLRDHHECIEAVPRHLAHYTRLATVDAEMDSKASCVVKTR